MTPNWAQRAHVGIAAAARRGHRSGVRWPHPIFCGTSKQQTATFSGADAEGKKSNVVCCCSILSYLSQKLVCPFRGRSNQFLRVLTMLMRITRKFCADPYTNYRLASTCHDLSDKLVCPFLAVSTNQSGSEPCA